MRTQCECCGTCCRNGGAPLHASDIGLVSSGILLFDDLVTIRRGELVVPPMSTVPVPAAVEWIKIRGQGSGWACRFLDISSNTCTMYENRPVSCRALKCWDTGEILAMAGRDLLNRFDLIDCDDPLLPSVLSHEERCPMPDMERVTTLLTDKTMLSSLLQELTELVVIDLRLRGEAVRRFDIPVAKEMFFFGRPLFRLLLPLGIETTETSRRICLSLKQK